ncbi:efflux RND transporter periplasmic adaptor subunit [Silicimonas algicola]|uniref:Multidrug efflux system membrane fusion protein n=1 Tax=Silicimonas algicola TaxID=1826607 RepID=A0A316G4Z2_9RHOB|nr:efflux RND transporter periplasmic adaptor subunit [Silicimonas algicola]AZQ68889.1 efflux RND transporter periplasmic adaptor subunit [Silicimonas algicola]PWK56014.1 multidrug efflux system membrane fusion protein [Silicimonas algicola]
MRFHTLLAIIVLVVAGAWVATGEFTSVGSEAAGESAAAAPAPEPEAAPASEPELQTVAFAFATNSDYQRMLQVSGVTKADKASVLAARTAGVIAALPVAKGSAVDDGDLIMALDGPEKYTAVQAAESLLEQREKAAAADQKLLASGQVGRLRIDASQAELVAARSALDAARAEVDRLEVRAPFAGIVDDVMVEAGAWVQPGTNVASIIALDPIIATGEISEQNLPMVSVGGTAEVTFADGTTADGVIRYIRREASDLTRTFPLEIAVPNPDLKVSAGMSVTIRLEASPVSSILVPRSVITLGPKGEIGVRIIEEDDTVGFLPVEIVDDTASGLVVAGIEDGMRVIVSGQDLVNDGQSVVGVDQTAAAAALLPSE